MAIAHAGSTAPSAYNNATTLDSDAMNVSPGDFLIGWFTWEDLDPTSLSVTDDAGNSWTVLTEQNGGGPSCTLAWTFASGSYTGNIVHITFNASASFGSIGFSRYTDVDASPADGNSGGTGSSAAPAAAAITTSVANALVVLLAKLYGPSSFTNGSWFSGSGTERADNADTVGFGELLAGAAGSYTPNSAIGSTITWAARAAAFKPSTGLAITGSSISLPMTAGSATITVGPVTVTGASQSLPMTAGAASITTQTPIVAGSVSLPLAAGAATITTAITVTGASQTLPMAAGAASISTGPVTVAGASVSLPMTAGAATVSVANSPQTVDGASQPLPMTAGAASISTGPVTVQSASNVVPLAAGQATISQGGGAPQTVDATSVGLALTAGLPTLSTTVELAVASTTMPLTVGAASISTGPVQLNVQITSLPMTAGAASILQLTEIFVVPKVTVQVPDTVYMVEVPADPVVMVPPDPTITPEA